MAQLDTTRIETLYREFENTDETSARLIAERSDLASQTAPENFRKLMEILFPRLYGSIYPGKKIWQELQSLAGSDSTFQQILSEKIRFYHFDKSGGNIGAEIKNWYNKSRPSAHSYLGKDANGKPNIKEATFEEFLLSCISNASSTSQGESADTTAKEILDNTPALTMIAVDTPAIDIKMRHSDTTSVFLNYLPFLE